MKRDHLIAVYDTHDDAASGVEALLHSDVHKEAISVLGKGEAGEPKDTFEVDKENNDIVYWGKQGAFWGGLWGFLMGAFFLWIPGFGPLVATGPIIASLAGALGGAATVGSLAALTSWFVEIGVEEVEAHHYTDLLKNGKTIVLVHGNKEEIEKAKEALDSLGKGEIKVYLKS